MGDLTAEPAPFMPNPNQQTPTFKFTSHPTLSSFCNPVEKYIANRLNATPPPKSLYRYIAVGALVFSDHADPDHDTTINDTAPAGDSSTPVSPGSAQLENTAEPRILLIRRAAHDSVPLKWEIPGGLADPEDASILHACARELYEEAGLVATSITSIVSPEGRLFVTGTGNVVCKFEFLVSVEGQGQGERNGGVLQVRLDPNEHMEYLWATEVECRQRRVGKGDQAIELLFTDEGQRGGVLDGFGLMRDLRARSGTELTVSSAL